MSSTAPESPAVTFTDLGLPEPILAALRDVGYESPSPIQAATIPILLEGRDLVGQAQTGTGKTAAFALPILARIDVARKEPQALVLAPTRELAIQVAEAFASYATHLPGFNVLPIYGGQSYVPQLASLKRGAHVVVGTPGRIIDHLERGTLKLDGLAYMVLDEADEMLRMGFIDDVESILQKTPPTRQIALFSATMPQAIRRIASNHLRTPAEVTIKAKTSTATQVQQRYWMVSGMHKLDALTRILEVETFEAMIVFARTKVATEELAEKLAARGFATAALNGDIQQAQRERTVQRLKDGQVDILVATDVAARGLDVDRISHVVNYDIPTDTESYVHRIGRTGRAGRSGQAILFVTPREKGMLHAIERATRQKIDEMKLPTVEAVNDQRIAKFKQRISDTLATGELELFQQLIEQYEQEHDVPAIEIAAALARIAQGDRPLLMTPPPKREFAPREPEARHGKPERAPRERGEREHSGREQSGREQPRAFAGHAPRPHHTEAGKITYRIEVGHEHGVKPGNIIGAIANEAGLDSQYIGRLSIRGDHSLVDLPEGMPKEIFEHLKKVWVARQQLQIHAWDGKDDGVGEPGAHPARRPGGFRKDGGFKPAGARPDPRKPRAHGGKPPRK